MALPPSPTPTMPPPPSSEQHQPPAVALATQKRKFHRLLDNLTGAANTSTTSLSSTLNAPTNASTPSVASLTADPAVPEPPPKRSRVSDTDPSTAMQRSQARVVSSSERIKAIQEKLFAARKALSPSSSNANANRGTRTTGAAGIRGVNNSTPAKLSTPRKEPNFQPFSQEQFLKRLKTFADVKMWTNKPEGIGEVEWAKRGWVCEGWNTVACKGGCEQRVVVKLYPRRRDAEGKDIEMSEDVEEEVEEGLVERYRELVVQGHFEDCLWRRRGCGDDIYHIPIPNRALSTAALLTRYTSLLAIAPSLPLQENITHPGPSISSIVAQLSKTNPNLFAPSAPPTSHTDHTALALALFGWSGVSESSIALATCTHCFQRTGLWLYASERLKQNAEKLDVPIESLRLDLLESHREHCPWENGASQRNPADGPVARMPAWETLQFMLLGGRGMGMGRERDGDGGAGHRKHLSVTTVNTASYRDSTDLERPTTAGTSLTTDTGGKGGKDGAEGLNEKWRKFKAKLRRTTSRRSLKSVRSVKSTAAVDKEGLNGNGDMASPKSTV